MKFLFVWKLFYNSRSTDKIISVWKLLKLWWPWICFLYTLKMNRLNWNCFLSHKSLRKDLDSINSFGPKLSKKIYYKFYLKKSETQVKVKATFIDFFKWQQIKITLTEKKKFQDKWHPMCFKRQCESNQCLHFRMSHIFHHPHNVFPIFHFFNRNYVKIKVNDSWKVVTNCKK